MMSESDELRSALQLLAPATSPAETEAAFRSLVVRSRRRRRLTFAMGVLALVLIAGLGMLVVNGLPDRERDLVASGDSSGPSTTIADAAPAVASIEISTWAMDADNWNPVWVIDSPSLIEAIATQLVDPGRIDGDPNRRQRAAMRIEFADGTTSIHQVDLETGWVEPNYQLTPEVTRQLRSGLDEATATAWQDVDLTDPDAYVATRAREAGMEFGTPEAAVEAWRTAFEDLGFAELQEWFAEPLTRDHPDWMSFVIRERGSMDDTVRGMDIHVDLRRIDGVWTIDSVRRRDLCMRDRCS